MARWQDEIVNRHRGRVTNGRAEAVNHLVKRAAFGFRRSAHYRSRALLQAGEPNWTLLVDVTPRRKPKLLIRRAGIRPSSGTHK